MCSRPPFPICCLPFDFTQWCLLIYGRVPAHPDPESALVTVQVSSAEAGNTVLAARSQPLTSDPRPHPWSEVKLFSEHQAASLSETSPTVRESWAARADGHPHVPAGSPQLWLRGTTRMTRGQTGPDGRVQELGQGSEGLSPLTTSAMQPVASTVTVARITGSSKGQ